MSENRTSNRRRNWLAAMLCAAALAGPAAAESVRVEGVAPIRQGDTAAAREQAVRSALAEAARRGSLEVGASSGSHNGYPSFDQVVVRGSTQVRQYRVIGEGPEGEVYRVVLDAELHHENSAAQPARICRGKHTKRLLIGGFPVLRPEHLAEDELGGYARLTARELAQRFPQPAAIFVDYSGNTMLPYRVVDHDNGAVRIDEQSWSQVKSAVQRHRAQYLLVGHFRSLSVGEWPWSRDLVLEALIIDGNTGAMVARKTFSRSINGRVRVPNTVLFGSPEHYDTAFGRAYGEVLDELARWAEATTSCLTFFTQVVKVEGQAAYFDAGAEHGIAIGDTFTVYRPGSQPIRTPTGEVLGYDKRPIGELVVTAVYPRFAVGMLQDPANGQSLRLYDELHSH